MLQILNFSTGCFSLFVGAMFYVFFRSCDNCFFGYLDENSLPIIEGYLSTDFADSLFFGSMPTFLHVTAYSLMTASFISYSLSGIIIIPLFWVLTNLVFELFQIFWPKYYGYFDIYDIYFGVIGGLVSFAHLAIARAIFK